MSGLHIAATTGNVLGPEAVDVTWCQDCRRNCASKDPCGCCAADVEAWPGWELTCYGTRVDEFDDIDAALKAGDAHIRACPQGAMPWADPVQWHVSDRDDRDVWAAAANGEWLNHHVRPLTDEPEENQP